MAKSGEERVYESVLLRREFRDDAKSANEMLANLSKLPPEAVVNAIEATLKGRHWCRRAGGVHDHGAAAGHVAAVREAHRLGEAWLRVRRAGAGSGVRADRFAGDPPGQQAIHAGAWPETTLGADLGMADASTREISCRSSRSPPHALALAILPYDGKLFFGINADRAAMPNLDVVQSALLDEFNALLSLAQA